MTQEHLFGNTKENIHLTESDWTRWAKNRGIKVSLTPLCLDRTEDSTIGSAYVFNNEFNRIHFFLNHWSPWIARDFSEDLLVKKLD